MFINQTAQALLSKSNMISYLKEMIELAIVCEGVWRVESVNPWAIMDENTILCWLYNNDLINNMSDLELTSYGQKQLL